MWDGFEGALQALHASWVLVKECSLLSYHNKETMLFTIDPYYGNRTQLLTRTPVSMIWHGVLASGLGLRTKGV